MSLSRLDHLGSLKLKELEIFYMAAKTKSIREVARRLGTTPGQVSKAIKMVERKMQTTLFKRSNSGIVLSETGAQLVLFSEGILESAYKMESLHRKDEKKTLAIAATSFLINHLVAASAVQMFEGQEDYTLRFLDLPPDQMVTSGLRGAFEVAFHFGKLDWPQTWHSQKVGAVEWVLCMRAKHPLKKDALRADVLKYPFILPTYWSNEGLAKGNDFFEVPVTKRIQGYETSTADAAIPILLQTNHVACLPSLLVRSLVQEGALKIVRMKDSKPTERELFVSVKSDALKASVFEALKENIVSRL